MKALAISTSPRPAGNTVLLLERLVGRLQAAGLEAECLSLAGSRIRGCTGCGACRKNQDRRCVIADDDFHPFFAKILAADILVIGSPVYFGSATPECMALLDRAGYVSRSNGNLLARKLGSPVVVARRAGHNFTLAQLLCWYYINDMIMVGSSYWSIAFGRAPGEALADQEAVATLDRLADNLAWAGTRLTAQG